MERPSRYSRLHQRIHEKGLVATAATVARRMVNDHVPARLLRFRRNILCGMSGLAPDRIPILSGVTSRCIAPDEVHQLNAVSLRPSRSDELFGAGSICAVAEAGGAIAAMAWARPGPGDCMTDDNFSHGFRWQLEAGEAWLHEGEARPDMRGTGVYLAAFRRLMEELVARGVTHCYGRIAADNVASLAAHRRLGMLPIAELLYTRVAMIGVYQWRSPLGNGSMWTMKRSLTLRPGDFRPAETKIDSKKTQ